MEYEIKIVTSEPYEKLDVQYETEDGKVYSNSYSVPEKMKYKKVKYESGETGYEQKEVFSQRVDKLDINAVIKAINNI